MLYDGKGNKIPEKNNFNINIGPDDIKPIMCKKCGCPFFIQAIMFGIISKIKIASNEDKIVPIGNELICVQCGTSMSSSMEEGQEEITQDPKQNISVTEEEIPEKDISNIIKLGR